MIYDDYFQPLPLKVFQLIHLLFLWLNLYNFVNHYNWIFNGTPGGHDTKIAHQDAAFIQKKYNKILDNLDITDTLIAIAKK